MNEVEIVNAALMRIGISDLVTSSDGTLASATSTGQITSKSQFWFPLVRDQMLSSWYWRFARKYALLVEASDGSGPPAEAWSTEWDSAFTVPADMLRARRFVSGTQAPYATWRYPEDADRLYGYNYKFVVRVHNDVKVLLANVPPALAHLEYTEAITDAERFPSTFAMLLAWRLAVDLAGPLSSDASLAQFALVAYQTELPLAMNIDANEEQAPDAPDDVFVTARGAS